MLQSLQALVGVLVGCALLRAVMAALLGSGAAKGMELLLGVIEVCLLCRGVMQLLGYVLS